ncbi:MAG: TauD/TfdA family dioxygenase [Mycobacteriales bacterium]
MLTGSFVEAAGDRHVRLRAELLDRGAVLPGPAPEPMPAAAADGPRLLADRVLAALGRDGLAVLALDRSLDTAEFRALGRLLGTLTPELDPAVQPFVEDGVVLNLRDLHGRTADVALQPFSQGPLTLHSEGSGRPVADQPRYIVLMCLQPGRSAVGAQTALVPMAEVAAALDERSLGVLAQTRYRASTAGPSIVRTVGDRTVFSFRDFAGERLDWVHTGDAGAAEVGAVLRRLLAALYRPGPAAGVRWAPGMVVVVDNRRYFHGRTAAPTGAAPSGRHLKRLRIR